MMIRRDHERLTRLFLQAAEIDPHDREAFLARVCEGDPDLRAEIEALLRHAENAPSILDTAAFGRPPSSEPPPRPERVGPYRIVEELGRGGMGVVYRAEQQRPIRRQVALKLIKLGCETEQVVARFNSERRALALMDHPNIARVLDAGSTPEGRPYFAMELVSGEPITAFCDSRRLTLNERLELFVQVCNAVHHAHQNSIIHRDIKPSNVLVDVVDGKPIPKIIDFGIAKALAHDGGGGIAMTEIGQLIGTPEYMSPEQATPMIQSIDTRADVYSLGALLYELLAGGPPFDSDTLRRSDLDEVRRRIREQEPPPPSARVAGDSLRAVEVADARRTSPSSLARRLRGDLDCIVMKALQKDRARRYGSASELGADVRRYLANDPIEARPAGALYRFGRFAGKHRTGTAVVSLLVPLLLGFAVTTKFQAHQIARERDRAEELSEFLVRFYDAPYFVSGRHYPAKPAEILTRSAARIGRELGDRPLLRARLTHAMGDTLRSVGDLDSALPLLETAVARLRELFGAEHPRTLAARNDLAKVHAGQGRTEEAERMFREVLAARHRVLGAGHPDTLRTMNDLAFLYKMDSRHDEAAPLFASGLDGMRAALGHDDPETLTTASLLASVQLDLGWLDDAQALIEDTLPRMGEELLERPMALYNLACIHARRGQRDDALKRLQQALDAGFGIPYWDPHLESLFDDSAFLALFKRSRVQDARVIDFLDERGRELIEAARYEEAEALYRYVVEQAPKRLWAETSRHRGRLFTIYMRQGRFDDARRFIEQEIESERRERGPNSMAVAWLFWSFAQAQLGSGAVTEAIESLEESERISADLHGSWGWAAYTRACRAALRGDRIGALGHFREAVEHGFPHIHVVRRERAFASLRGTQEFRQIFATLSRRFDVP